MGSDQGAENEAIDANKECQHTKKQVNTISVRWRADNTKGNSPFDLNTFIVGSIRSLLFARSVIVQASCLHIY